MALRAAGERGGDEELQPDSEGRLHLDSTCVPKRRVEAFGDLVYINGLWAVGRGDFVEMHM